MTWQAKLGRGWRQVGRPARDTLIRVWAVQRVDLCIYCVTTAVVPGGLGVALSRGLRLLLAARLAKRAHLGQQADGEEEEGREVEEARALQPAAAPPAGPAAASSPARAARRVRTLPTVKGLPPLPLPRIPPGSITECSVQPVGLPMLLIGQSAARAPMYAGGSGNRLVRGLAGIAAYLLLSR